MRSKMRCVAISIMMIGVLFTSGSALYCMVELDRLLLPKPSVDIFRINTVTVSYSFILPESLCVKIDRQAKARKKPIEADGCLNGLGYVGTIQIRRDPIREGDVDEIFLGCDEFAMGTFTLGKKWYGYQLPISLIDELHKMERDSESFHEASIDSAYYYKKKKER